MKGPILGKKRFGDPTVLFLSDNSPACGILGLVSKANKWVGGSVGGWKKQEKARTIKLTKKFLFISPSWKLPLFAVLVLRLFN